VTEVREQVALSAYTTLRLGGPARRFVADATEAEVVAEVQAVDERGEPLLVLGGGSNLVVADEGFAGTVVRVATKGVRCAGADPVTVTVAAGEDWDSVVAWSVNAGLAGLECLSGIPGLAGATPIQNVGAYGQDVAETIITVRAFDRLRRKVVELAAADCGFGYRTSAFKRDTHASAKTASTEAGSARAGSAGAGAGFAGARAGSARAGSARAGSAGAGSAEAGAHGVTGRFVVLEVTFRLARSPMSAPVRYRELAAALGVAEGGSAPLADVRAAVLGLRRSKGMVLDAADPDTRSAGSFFTNPVLDPAQFAALEQAVASILGPGMAIPQFPAPGGLVKVSAAWLIERAGFGKGYPGPGRNGTGPRISSKHTLALVNPGGATTASLLGLARDVREGVRRSFDVELTPEPILVGVHL
jgi:UDP-N-acetylmuramate dehydrogenase